MTSDDYNGFEKEKIAQNPMLQLAWDISQIVDEDAPLRWFRHKMTARCLMNGYIIQRKSNAYGGT